MRQGQQLKIVICHIAIENVLTARRFHPMASH